MGILRADRITGLGGANAIKGSVEFTGDGSSSTSRGVSLNIHSGDTDKTDLDFGTGNFTFEAWIYPFNGLSFNCVYSQAWGLQIYADTVNNRLQLYVNDSDNSSSYIVNQAQSANGTILPDRWNHIAVVRNGTSFTMYTNGTGASPSTGVSAAIASSNADYTVGIFNSLGATEDLGSYFGFAGYISNLRIRTGAQYTSNFTPPVGELQKTSDTVLLCCQSSADSTKEETGKIIVPTIKNLNDKLPAASKFTPNSPVGFSTTSDVGSQYGTTFNGFGNFATSTYMVPPGGNTRERNRGRAVFGGGASTSYTSSIQTFNIQSQGNTVEVSELTSARWGLAAAGSATRGLFGGGRTAPGGSGTYLNTIEFVTIANVANSIDFGDLTRAGSFINALGNETRGIWAGGYDVDTKPATNIGQNTIDYVTIATAGNAADFGDMVRQDGSSDTTFSKFSTANSTRGLIAGGYNSGGEQDEITYITIATTGNSTYFGDLTAVSAFGGSGASSSTRGILTVGGTPGPHNRIDFVTIATTGNATDFGDLTLARRYAQGVSNKTRAVFITGYTGADTNLIDFVTIATTGNATDFGDNDREDNYANGATSDSHGGLS
jgi:hypothetical protein